MRRAFDALLIIGVLAVLFSVAAPVSAYADDSASVARVVTVAVDSPDSLLTPSAAPGYWWGGWGGWPWWAGMPLGAISAMSGGAWPWFCCWQMYTGWGGLGSGWGGGWPWWGSSSWSGGWGGWPGWGSGWGGWGSGWGGVSMQ